MRHALAALLAALLLASCGGPSSDSDAMDAMDEGSEMMADSAQSEGMMEMEGGAMGDTSEMRPDTSGTRR